MNQPQTNTIAFTDETFALLKALAQHENTSIERLLSKAIKTEMFFQEQQDLNRKVMLETANGKLLRIEWQNMA